MKRAMAALFFLLAVVARAPAAHASTWSSAQLVVAFEWATDVERGHAGLPALELDPAQSSEAQGWSELLAFTGTLAEDPGTQVAVAAEVPGWRQWGENVGVGATPQSVEGALMASAPHRANILGDFTHLGVGVVVGDDGRIWVTERFWR